MAEAKQEYEENLCPSAMMKGIQKAQYAVRGEIVRVATQISSELKDEKNIR